MEALRKGNDFNIVWEILEGRVGELPYDLSGKDLSLYVRSIYATEKILDFTVERNLIKWTFKGKDQKHNGVYSLILVENEGQDGMHTVDECDAFKLVDCSCKTGGDSESRVNLQTIRLRSAIQINTIVPDKVLDPNSSNVVTNAAITERFEEIGSPLTPDDIDDVFTNVFGGGYYYLLAEGIGDFDEIEEGGEHE